ncbi:PREDICTED: membrane-spanning 4-domains subfamily A member 18 [Elephantulus edwardii]|uniref:membrane-spanning 4-domains subfamily A member 18 n=1 Tax=Elephantulus edwardii TaxID=28737 RepID=UPI0003F0D597|nr:PREDICTED: membrane-spanning 4-domains subfamily A member 18 [Elephantulus edwardii]
MTTVNTGAARGPTVIAPNNVHIIQSGHPVPPGSHVQPFGVTAYPASTMVQCDTGRAHFPSHGGVAGAQNQPILLQYPAGTVVQTSPVVVQGSTGTTNLQSLPQNLQNPPNFTPQSTGPSSQFQGNPLFTSFYTFDPKKFINEEVRTLGAIQILIGLTHFFSGMATIPYIGMSVTTSSGYTFWGGLFYVVSGSLSVQASKDTFPCVVNSSIGMNIVSTIVSLTGAMILLSDMIITNDTLLKLYCGGIFPFALLEFCLTCVASYFGCQATCWNQFTNMTLWSNMFHTNPVNTASGPYSSTSGLANAPPSPANVNTGPADTTNSSFSATTGSVTTTTSSLSTATSSLGVTNRPANTVPAPPAPSPAALKQSQVQPSPATQARLH